MPFATAGDGVMLSFEIFGNGRPLVLIPGLGGSSRVWGPFPKAMGMHFTTLAYDPRGFGASPAPASSITMESMVSDLGSLIGILPGARAHLFGISMGGIVAQRFAAEHPEMVDRMVLVSTTGRMTRWSGRILDAFEIMARFLPPREFVNLLATFSLSPAYFEARASRPADLENALLPSESEMESIKAQIRALRALEKDQPENMPRVPALIVSGKRDFLTPPSAAMDLHSSIPSSKLVMLEGGHACLLENTEEGVMEMLAFLNERDPAALSRSSGF